MISSISKTDQLKQILLEDIKGGVFKPGEKLPSILNICKKYNVSKHTVSQTLSNLSELGIIELAHGKATRVSEEPFKKNIEIFYNGDKPIDQEDFWSVFYQGIISEIGKHPGYSYNVRSSHENNEKSLIGFDIQDLKGSVGALIMGTSDPRLIDMLRLYGVKFILVYDQTDSRNVSYISTDYDSVMEEMVGLFKKQGCSKISYIGFYDDKNYKDINTSKYEMFAAAMKKQKLKFDPSMCRQAFHNRLETAYEAMKSILDSGEIPDGIFLSSDVLAIGVYRALHEAGLKVPEDIKIAGCDNLSISKFLVPSLTSIELFRQEIGETAVKNLISCIENGSKEIQLSFTPKIEIRESLN